MLNDYFKVSIRNVVKDKFFTAINLTGLCLGIAGFVVIVFYIKSELSFDKFHCGSENIFRVTTFLSRDGKQTKWALAEGIIDQIIPEQVSEVKSSTILYSTNSDMLFEHNDQTFVEDHVFFTDADFFNVFDFSIISGDSSSMLDAPNSIVITESMAIKYFGRTDLGGSETILWRTTEGSEVLKVTGIVQDSPRNSHIQFSFLITGNTISDWDQYFTPNFGFMMYVYFRTRNYVDIQIIEEKINRALDSYKTDVYGDKYTDVGSTFTYQNPVQRLTDIHFNADNDFEIAKGGKLFYVKALGGIGGLLLFLVSFNYVNISIAKSFRRRKEVGIRKVLGSQKSMLIGQFLTESVIVCLSASFLAFILILSLSYTLLNQWLWFIGETVSYVAIGIVTLLVGLGIGIIAGFFPAWGITALATTQSLQNKSHSQKHRAFHIRDVLLVAQFALTICLIISSITIFRQVSFFREALGVDTGGIITIDYPSNIDRSQWNSFIQSAQSEASINNIAGSVYPLISNMNSSNISLNKGEEDRVRILWNGISNDFISTSKIDIVEGRDFSPDISSDSTAIIINEAAKRELGIRDVVGSKVYWPLLDDSSSVEVIGVVSDYHFQSFQNAVSPVVLFLAPKERQRHLLVDVSTKNFQYSIERLEAIWKESEPEVPFNYSFLSDSFRKLIEQELLLSKLVAWFTIIFLFVTCLGLIGLAGLLVKDKRKEISIRKIHGASLVSILLRINRRFATSIFIAFVIAAPISFWLVTLWLRNFVYKIHPTLVEYIITGAFVLFVTALVTSYQSIKAATENPIDSLQTNE